MIEALLNPVLPVFSLIALGALLTRLGLFQSSDAAVINRFVVYVCIPALMIRLIGTADFADFDWPIVSLYLISELCIYGIGYVIGRNVFHIEQREAVLLGFAACFSNNLFFVWPIASILLGDAAGKTAVALMTVDTLLIFGATFVLIDVLSSKARSIPGAALTVLRNPITVILLIAWIINLLNVPLHAGVMTLSNFAGNAAAPTALFAMGIVVSQVKLGEVDTIAVTLTILKLLIHPLIAFGLLVLITQPDAIANPEWEHTMLMVTAGPLGVLPFVIAMQHNIRPDTLMRAIVYSTVLSLLTLSMLAAFLQN